MIIFFSLYHFKIWNFGLHACEIISELNQSRENGRIKSKVETEIFKMPNSRRPEACSGRVWSGIADRA